MMKMRKVFRAADFSSLLSKLVLLVFALLSVSAAGCRQKKSFEEMYGEMTPEMRQQLAEPSRSTPMIVEGIDAPRFVSADNSYLRGTEDVIGVVMLGQPRAYPVSKMSGIIDHVVNDHVVDPQGDPKPFTVTYCDLTDCARVLQAEDDRNAESLGIGTLGLLDGGLALYWEQSQFKQTEEVARLRDVPFQRMSWDQWKAEHPTTVVYAGSKLSPDERL